jgi:hypothetical protein
LAPGGPRSRESGEGAAAPQATRPRVRSGQTNPLWAKITPGMAGLAAGSHARRPALNGIREFRKTMPRPRRGSELVFGGPRAAKSSCRCHRTHPTTGNPHVGRISVICTTYSLVTWSGAPCGATWRSRHPSCTERACSHNWTSREPVFAAGTEGILVQCISKGLVLPAYLLTSLALRSDGVLYIIKLGK